jgi:hypothetical protein
MTWGLDAGGGRHAKGETKIMAATRFVACD